SSWLKKTISSKSQNSFNVFDNKSTSVSTHNGRAILFYGVTCKRIGKLKDTRTGRPFCTPGFHFFAFFNKRIAASPEPYPISRTTSNELKLPSGSTTKETCINPLAPLSRTPCGNS